MRILSYRKKISQISENPGIYIFYGFDDTPLYVGKSGNLKNRLGQHFIRFDSSIIADRTLDPYEVAYIRYWVFKDSNEISKIEHAVIFKYQPKFNLSTSDLKRKSLQPNINIPREEESTLIDLDLPESKRGEPLLRIKNKSHLINEMARKFELSGVTKKAKLSLIKHCEELLSIAEKI